MKEITIYECEDGSRFDNRKEAAKYDKVIEKINLIMAPIGEPVTESYSAKQRDKDAVENAVTELSTFALGVSQNGLILSGK